MNNDDSLNVSPPSLPKGGGAIRSIGDGLGAVGPRGAASFELPLPISPGRGFAPALALSYSSGVGNSPFGMGWSKTINAIARRTSKGAPSYSDDDLFVGPDGNTLMPERNSSDGTVKSRTETQYRGMAVGSHQVTRFWPRAEGAFALIERWTADADQAVFWLIHSADGTLHLYGKSADARRADPEDESRVAAWLIQESVEPLGQHVAYEYRRDNDLSAPDDPHDYRAQRYLTKVHYGNAEASEHLYSWAEGGWASVQWHFHLVFDYGERTTRLDEAPEYAETQPWERRSTDAFSDYSYGFELRIRRICRQVLMFHRFAELGDEPVLVQRLVFQQGYGRRGCLNLAAAHYQACDGDGKLHSRPPMEFFYQPFDPVMDTTSYQPFDAMAGLNDGNRYHLVDLDGEGTAGILYRSDKGWYYRAPKRAEPAAHPNEVAYDEWRELERIPIADSSKPVRQFLTDITGDGSLDWVVAQPGWSGFFTRQPDGSWDNFAPLNAVPNEFFHPRAQMADLMLGGLQDLVMIGPRSVRLYASRLAEGFAAGQELEHLIDDDRLPLFSDARNQLVAFADVLGSGQQHLIEVRHNQVKCWPNLGRGRFGKGFVWSTLPFSDEEFDAARVLFADFDGSGAVDLVWLQPDCALIYMNICGNGFEKNPLRLPWPSGVTWDRFCQVSAADLQGQGFSSLVLTLPHMVPRHWRCDLIQAKPYILCATNNNLGAAGNIVYRSSAQEWLDEKAELKARSAAAVSHLPFSMPLVSVQTQTDEITGNQLTQRFSYRNGFYDSDEREFLGFGRQNSTDCEAQVGDLHEEGYAAPVLRKTWFHAGVELEPPRDDFFKGDPNAEPLGEMLLSHYHLTDKVDQWVEADELERAHMRYALAGQISRSETYALDKPDGVPYTVEEHRYAVRRLDPPIGGTHARYPVMQVLPLENIAYQYEQDATDPMCQKTLNLAWDEFGNLTQGVAVTYARRLTAADDPACALDPGTIAPEKRWWCDAHDSAQQSYYLTETLAQFIHLDKLQGWRLGLPYLQRSNALELKKGAGPDGLTPDCISFEHFTASTPDNPLNLSAQRILVGQSLQRYRKLPENTTWTEGQADFLALPDYLEVAELDNNALTAYSLLEKEGVMPFDLEEKLLEVGYHRMAWVLGQDLDGNPLWSIKRGFNTYADKANFYQVTEVRQTQSHGVTLLGYDPHRCLNISVTLPDGCETRVDQIDYRLMQAARIIDPNKNYQEALHGAFGQVLATSFYGTERGVKVVFKAIAEYQRPEDDSPASAIEAPEQALQDAATAYFENPFSWMGRVPEVERQKLPWLNECVTQGYLLPGGYVRARARFPVMPEDSTPALEHLLELLPDIRREPVHGLVLQADRYPGDPDKQIRMAINCWDGFGRSLQSKQKVEDGYAYKVLENGSLALEGGKPVTLADVPRWRVSERVEYNNKGLVVRTYRPYFAQGWLYINDASFRQHGYHDKQFYDPLGRPTNTVLAKEGYLRRVTYRDWSTINEDENDTCEEVMAEGEADVSRGVHTQTPSLAVLEPRGQVALDVAYCRSRPGDLAQRRITRTRYNTAGQAMAQWDPRLHDLHKDDPRVPPNLATVYSLSGQVLSTQSVDAAQRIQLFGEARQGVYFQDGRGTQRQVEFDSLLRPLAVFEQDLCTERFSYGGSSAGHNQCGQLTRHDDPAGTRHLPEYAMGGAVLDQVQHFLQTLDTPDWPAPPEQRDDLLEHGEGARTLSQFNALGEALQQTDAAGNLQGSHYTVDGQLREAWLQLTGSPSRKILVSAIAYDAHGRTERKSLGNGVVSQFDYCPQDGRLLRLYSRRSSGEALQDLHYVYDPVGNIVSIEDKTQPVRFFANQRIDPIKRYTYDSLYQLCEATGFEAGSARQGPNHLADPLAVANFRQTYRYDLGGNLLELIHHGPQNHGRVLTAARYSNRCLPERDGVPPTEAEIAAAFDANGNLLELEAGRALHWDWRNQLAYVRPVERKAALDDIERYIYGADGMRQRKVRTTYTNARAVLSETRYLPGLEVRTVYGDVLHVVSAGEVQVLHWETAPPTANDQYRYSLADHLGSWSLELDSQARVVSRESYHPFGSTAFWERGDSSEESYRTLGYSGKERDATGLYYYGHRYYMTHIQRWVSPDPAGVSDGLNVFSFCGNNSINRIDLDGLLWQEPEDGMLHDTLESFLEDEAGWRMELGLPVINSAEEDDNDVVPMSDAESEVDSPVSTTDPDSPDSPLEPSTEQQVVLDILSNSAPALRYNLNTRGLLARENFGGKVYRADRRNPNEVLQEGFNASDEFTAIKKMISGSALIVAESLEGAIFYAAQSQLEYHFYEIDANEVRGASLLENLLLNTSRTLTHIDAYPDASPSNQTGEAHSMHEAHLSHDDLAHMGWRIVALGTLEDRVEAVRRMR